MANTAVYLAGKIAKSDWRHDLVSGLRTALSRYQEFGESDRQMAWPVMPKAVDGWADYTGPFFLSCDHGCYHRVEIPDTSEWTKHRCDVSFQNWARSEAPLVSTVHGDHGCAAGGFAEGGAYPGIDQGQLIKNCISGINRANVVFAWIEENDAYGTLCEIGLAVGLSKTVITASSPEEHPWTRDMWFPRGLANSHILAEDPVTAFRSWAAVHNNHTQLAKTESPIERKFLEAVLALDLPELRGLQVAYPVDNGRYRLDFAIPDQRLGIELDGYEFHSSRATFTNDRQRERHLRLMGWDIIRFSGSEINEDTRSCVL